jgi:hypothetical protein
MQTYQEVGFNITRISSMFIFKHRQAMSDKVESKDFAAQ